MCRIRVVQYEVQKKDDQWCYHEVWSDNERFKLFFRRSKATGKGKGHDKGTDVLCDKRGSVAG